MPRRETPNEALAPPQPAATTAAHVLGAAAGVAAIALLVVARSMFAVALWTLVTDGAVAVAWLASATGIGLAALRAVAIRFQTVAMQLVTAAAAGLGLMSLLILAMGLVGILNQLIAIGIVVIGIALLFWSILPIIRRDRSGSAVSPWAWLWLVPAAVAGAALVYALYPPGVLWGDEPHGYDVVSYHLQIPREWFEAGRIASLPHNVFSFFPFNVEMHYLLAMRLRGGAWAGMFLAQLMHLGFVGLTVAAVYAVLAESGSRLATLGAVAAAGAPWLTMLGTIAYNEGGLLLFGTLSIGIVMIAMSRPDAPQRWLALAGALAGFACGTKLTGVPMVLLAVPSAMLVYTRSAPRRALLGAALFLACGLLAFAPWLVRNAAWAGNPVFPNAIGILGQAHFSDDQAERWRRAHAPREDQTALLPRLDAAARQILLDWRYGWVLIPFALVAGGTTFDRRETRFLLLLLFILAVVWLFLTHLQGRFFVLSIPIAGLIIGQIRGRVLAAVGAGVFIVMVIVGMVLLSLRPPRGGELLIGYRQLSLFSLFGDSGPPPKDRVILVGDARAFWYDVPMSRLRYRTVFDVPARDAETSLDAWLRGFDIEPSRTTLVIDPAELRRFEATYYAIPPLPAELRDRDAALLERR